MSFGNSQPDVFQTCLITVLILLIDLSILEIFHLPQGGYSSIGAEYYPC